MNQSGFCLCGCGLKTKPHPFSWKRKGWVKDAPRDYLQGHNARLPEVKKKLMANRAPLLPQMQHHRKLAQWRASERTRKALLSKLPTPPAPEKGAPA